MRFLDIIRKKRDGLALNEAEIQAVVDAVTHNTVPDYQVAAWLMAVYLNGMTATERGYLVRGMMLSGHVLDFSHLSNCTVDKHSTGGIGDKVSICLAPAVAACGVAVPMIAGRGLGHTGGTLDKLEAIPGFQVRLDETEFQNVVDTVGVVIAGQSAAIAPADKRLYALRDVTGTIESYPLIAASIMSKKLAEGLNGLVLDVKVGNGAFMKTHQKARELARILVDTGKAVDVATTAFITDMNQPLGEAVGNANETQEALDILHGGGPADLREITLLLGGEMCVLGGVAEDLDAGRKLMTTAIESGAALDVMIKMVEAQGGDPRICEPGHRLPVAPIEHHIIAKRDGVVCEFATEQFGWAMIDLGGGRRKVSDTIDHAVGIMVHKKLGDTISTGDVLATINARSEAGLDKVVLDLERAIRVGDECSPLTLVYEEMR
ncbi:MAG: thymidine phosphorylase [Myxococcota bacterium]|nr:thymidine phosphorylase [Myxococcota bacterium]